MISRWLQKTMHLKMQESSLKVLKGLKSPTKVFLVLLKYVSKMQESYPKVWKVLSSSTKVFLVLLKYISKQVVFQKQVLFKTTFPKILTYFQSSPPTKLTSPALQAARCAFKSPQAFKPRRPFLENNAFSKSALKFPTKTLTMADGENTNDVAVSLVKSKVKSL